MYMNDSFFNMVCYSQDEELKHDVTYQMIVAIFYNFLR